MSVIVMTSELSGVTNKTLSYLCFLLRDGDGTTEWIHTRNGRVRCLYVCWLQHRELHEESYSSTNNVELKYQLQT